MSSRHHIKRVPKHELNLRKQIKIIKDFQEQTKCNDILLERRFNGYHYRYALRKFFEQRDN